jgi:hypothetical protein
LGRGGLGTKWAQARAGTGHALGTSTGTGETGHGLGTVTGGTRHGLGMVMGGIGHELGTGLGMD